MCPPSPRGTRQQLPGWCGAAPRSWAGAAPHCKGSAPRSAQAPSPGHRRGQAAAPEPRRASGDLSTTAVVPKPWGPPSRRGPLNHRDLPAPPGMRRHLPSSGAPEPPAPPGLPNPPEPPPAPPELPAESGGTCGHVPLLQRRARGRHGRDGSGTPARGAPGSAFAPAVTAQRRHGSTEAAALPAGASRRGRMLPVLPRELSPGWHGGKAAFQTRSSSWLFMPTFTIAGKDARPSCCTLSTQCCESGCSPTAPLSRGVGSSKYFLPIHTF